MEVTIFSHLNLVICADTFQISSAAVDAASFTSSIDTRSLSWDICSNRDDTGATESSTKVWILASSQSADLAVWEARDLITWSTLGVLVASTLGNL